MSTQSPAKEAAATPPASRPLRVLVVDDHSDTLYALCALLRHQGHHVVPAVSGELALQIPRKDYDVAVLDLLTPQGLTGCELLQQLVERHGPLHAIAFSVAGSQADIARCTEVGFFRHVLKPDLPKLAAAFDAMAVEFRKG